MKKLLIAGMTMALTGLASVSGAETPATTAGQAGAAAAVQAKRTYPYNPFAQFNRLSEDLSLTKEQQDRILPVLEELEKELQPLKNLGLDKQGKRGSKFVQKRYGEVRDHLQPEQVEKFNDLVKKGMITSFTRPK